MALGIKTSRLTSPVVQLNNLERDGVLSKSLISSRKADETEAETEYCSERIQDSQGRWHHCSRKVTVRCWQIGVPVSFDAVFYISPACPETIDAIVGADICTMLRDQNQTPNCRPVQRPIMSPGKDSRSFRVNESMADCLVCRYKSRRQTTIRTLPMSTKRTKHKDRRRLGR